MPANNSPLRELQKELSKQCSPYSYTRVNAIENFKTLGEFWEEFKKFYKEDCECIGDLAFGEDGECEGDPCITIHDICWSLDEAI